MTSEEPLSSFFLSLLQIATLSPSIARIIINTYSRVACLPYVVVAVMRFVLRNGNRLRGGLAAPPAVCPCRVRPEAGVEAARRRSRPARRLGAYVSVSRSAVVRVSFVASTAPYLFMSHRRLTPGMPRPTVSEEHRDRLADFVDRKADVPAEVLTFDQQLEYVLDHVAPKRDPGGVNQAPTSSGSSDRFR